MKFNLKNRPKPTNEWERNSKVQLRAYLSLMEEWFQGFQKELRKMIQGDKDSTEPLFTETAMLIKEILGEP